MQSSQQKEKPAAQTQSDSKAGKAPGAFRTISEVANDLKVQQHVLRFWETKFTQIKPLKRGGGRRYYRPEDVALLKNIHNLLYTEGYTIKGVQKLLKSGPRGQTIEATAPAPAVPVPAAPLVAQRPSAPVFSKPAEQQAPASQGMNSRQRAILESMLGELKELRNMIKGE
jgi:DNA-binding transcriptional MerR regulator